MSPSRVLLYFCIIFISGIFISSFVKIPQLFMLGFLILAIFLILISWPRPQRFASEPARVAMRAGRYEKLVFFGFCIVFLVLGIWRQQSALFKIENSPIKNFLGEEVAILGIIDKEPDIRAKITRLEIKIEKIKKINNLEENSSEDLAKVLVTAKKYPEYKYGDKIIILGELKAPDVFEGFNYKDYLAKDGILSVMDFPEVISADGNFGSPFLKNIFSFKNKLKDSLNRIMPRPESAISEALLFGDEQSFSEDLKEKFNLTGTRHLAAVSGMNITIVSAILVSFLLLLGFWRHQAFYFSIIILIAYILMVGAPASAVRAGIMAILFLTAQHFGRLSSASRLIVFAATIILILNPLLLKSDIGFQLSFLAIMGMIFLQPIFSGLFKKIPNIFQLKNSLTATISAQIFTFPILIYNFGQISAISPIANILILPFIPFVTIFGFIFSLVGIFSQSLGQILSWPVYIALSYVIKVIDLFSGIPRASLIFKNIHWVFLLISYLILSIITWRVQERQKLKFLKT